MQAHAKDLDVKIGDNGIWVTQVQGPNAFKVLEGVVNGLMPEKFDYFDMTHAPIAGEQVVITRTGFTNELGWAYYLEPHQDVQAIGKVILEADAPFAMMPTLAEAFRARRIEAGLLNADSDFDDTTTSFAAGLGCLVEFDKGDFSGRDALLQAEKTCRTWGLKVSGGIAQIGRMLYRNGIACASAFLLYLDCGVAIIHRHGRSGECRIRQGDGLMNKL